MFKNLDGVLSFHFSTYFCKRKIIQLKFWPMNKVTNYSYPLIRLEAKEAEEK